MAIKKRMLVLCAALMFLVAGCKRESYRYKTYTVARDIYVDGGLLLAYYGAVEGALPSGAEKMDLVEVVVTCRSDGIFTDIIFTFYRYLNDSYVGGLVEYIEVSVNPQTQTIYQISRFKGTGKAAMVPSAPLELSLLTVHRGNIQEWVEQYLNNQVDFQTEYIEYRINAGQKLLRIVNDERQTTIESVYIDE